jgi:hypothetical protein
MADRSAANTKKRLSVWAATEPLPTPLPPPPRIQPTDASAAPRLDLGAANQIPTEPHLSAPVVTRPTCAATSPNRENTIPLPSVLASLAVTAVLLAIVGWLQIHQPQELDWPTLKSIALGQVIEPVIPESELPYVTVVPMLLNCDRTNVVERNGKSIKQAQQVTMSDIKPFESPDADSTTETQRR